MCFFHAWRNLGFFYAHFYGRRYRPWLTESWVLLSRLAEIPQLQTALKGVTGQISGIGEITICDFTEYKLF